jgi:hypothetical protein
MHFSVFLKGLGFYEIMGLHSCLWQLKEEEEKGPLWWCCRRFE